MGKGKKKQAKATPPAPASGGSGLAPVRWSFPTSSFSVRIFPDTSPVEPADIPTEQGAEPVVGYRQWGLRRRYPEGLLLTGAGGTVWKPLERLAAVCLRDKAHEAPVNGCQCGAYAFKEGVDLPTEVEYPVVFGAVFLWGRVVEHSDGFRGQYAYPKRLVLLGGSETLAVDLGLAYGVPCEAWT